MSIEKDLAAEIKTNTAPIKINFPPEIPVVTIISSKQTTIPNAARKVMLSIQTVQFFITLPNIFIHIMYEQTASPAAGRPLGGSNGRGWRGRKLRQRGRCRLNKTIRQL